MEKVERVRQKANCKRQIVGGRIQKVADNR